MAELPPLENRVRERRDARGWSQDEVARRAGLSRAGVSAIETGRLVPSASAALALAAAFGCRVEDLFHLRRAEPECSGWAWPPRREEARYWRAEVSGRTWRYPVEATPLGVVPHDGLYRDQAFQDQGPADPRRTLVVAGCDPAVGLLAPGLAERGVRLLALPRSSQAALGLLELGCVHAAGVHLARADAPEGNRAAVLDRLGPGHTLLRVARWEEGVAFQPGLRLATVREAVQNDLRWIGREAGSGARQCLDELRGARRPPRRVAFDHRGVAEAVRCGWADLGVCLRLVSEEAGLDFLSVREEEYDLCYPDRLEGDSRLQALTEVVRSAPYRGLLADLPGYDSAGTGVLHPVRVG